eukprot:1287997-Alexandrium_andersonii.AAC.1
MLQGVLERREAQRRWHDGGQAAQAVDVELSKPLRGPPKLGRAKEDAPNELVLPLQALHCARGALLLDVL